MEDTTNENIDIDQETFSKLNGTQGIQIFNQICRVCLCETNENDQQLDTTIILLQNAHEIKSLIVESTGVQILDLDFLPNHICDTCFNTLKAWYKLRSQTQHSNEVLKKYLKDLTTSSDSNSLPNSDVVPVENFAKIIEDFQTSSLQVKSEVLEPVFRCDSCTMAFTNPESLEKHQEEHSEPSIQKSFKCMHCSKSFVFRNSLHNHIQLLHKKRKNMKFQCDLCEKHYNTGTGLKMHKSKPCVSVDLIQQCKIQKMDFDSEEVIAVGEKIISETKVSCIMCKKNFKSNSEFCGHYNQHSNDRKCTICNKHFIEFKHLERHIRMHLRAKVCTCPMCSRLFYSIQSFRFHIKQHAKRKCVYKCNVCQKEFFFVKEFEKHMLKHLEAVENEKKALEQAAKNYLMDVNNMDVKNENESPIWTEENLKNEVTNQMEDAEDIQSRQEQFQIIKVEEDFEENESIKLERDVSFPTETDYCVNKVEADIPGDYEGFHLQSLDNLLKVNATVAKTEENFESASSSSDHENDDGISKYNEHISEHTKNILEKCKVKCHIAGCQTKCFNLYEIWKHFKKEHISEENPYNCCMCNKQFDNNNALRIHIRKYYSFKCPICSKLKPSSGLLKIHVILCHSNDRPYKCTKVYQKCQRPNALKSYNNKKCTICSKKFSTKAHLKLHINKNNCGRKKKKNVQKSKHNDDGAKIKETKDVNNTDMGHKMESNTSHEAYWKNDKTDKNADDISEETKKLLDKCKINCHIAGCETKCSTLPDMWQHFSNEHMSKEKPYKCSICFEEFENKRPLRLHIQKYYSFKCPVCSQLKTSNSALRKHIILIHSNDRPFKCGKCYKTYKRRYALKAHENSHRNIKQFVCSICSKEFTYKYALNIHLRRHRDIKELQCPICRKQFYRRANLKMHIINKNNNCGRKLKKSLKKANIQRTKNVNNIDRGYEMESDKSQEVCKTNHMEIDIQVKVENVLEHHVPIKLEQDGPVQIEKHNSKDIIDSEKKLQFEADIPAENQNLQLHNDENQFNPNTTEVTTDISFLKETVLNIESDDISSEEENDDEIDGEASNLSTSNEKITEETKKLLDKCKINCHIPGCETKCSTVPDIWQHFCNEHISKEKPFKCSICFKEFENKRHLRHHIKTYYSFKCPVCSIVKTSNSSLKRHVKICHSNERPFKCTKCYQKFKRPYALKAHENSHSNEKQFVCGICSKEFAYKNGLNVHLRRHRDIKELQCPICSQQFSTKAYLEMHIINKNINCGDKIKKSLEKPNFQETQNLNNIEKSSENHIPSKSEPDGSFQIEEHHSEDIICFEKKFQFHQDLQLHNVKNNQFNTNTTEVTTDTSFFDNTALNIESDNLSPEEGNADEIDIDLSILSQSNEETTDETKNQTQTNNDQEQFLLVKEEKNSEKNITNKSEENKSLQIKMDHPLDIIDCKQQFEVIETESQLETTSHGGIACQLQCEDNKLSNANAIDLKIEPSVLKETVTLDNSELGLSSAEEENSDENDDEISTVSKTSNNNQIAKNEPKEIIVKLLENFKLNCHIPGCKTVFQKCLHLNEIWKHFKKQHITERKPYKCCRCSKKFEKKHSLRFHIRKYYSFQCPYCTMLKFTLSELKKHVIQIHSTERSLKCSKCDKTFNRPGALKVHEVTHSDKKQFFCSICPKDFFSKMGLYLHSKSHENIKELQCPTCGKQFPSKNRLKRHTENTSCLREQTNVCLDDEKIGIENIHNIDTSVEMESSTSDQFYLENSTTTTQMKTNRRNYREQFQLVKEEMDSEIDTANNPEQDMCNQTEMDYSFDIDDSKPQFELIKTESQLQTTSQWVTDHESSKQEHQLQNKGNNLPITNAIELKTDQSNETSFEVGTEELLEKSKVNCHVAGCQAKLLSPNDIWEHFRSQHISKNRPYKCSICSEQLDDLREFRKHVRQYYTFRCPVCSKLTPDGSSLKRHVLLWHSNERPFKCSKCPKLSRTYRINKYHEKTHSKNSCGTEESFKNNDVTNVLEIENDMNLQIGNEFDSNILVENDFTNESTNQMKAYVLNGEGQFQLIKTEKDPFIDEIDSNQQSMLIKPVNQVQETSQKEIDTPTVFESSYPAIELQNFDNKQAIEVKTEISLPKEESDYSSCDKEYIEDDNDDATSALSKSNKQINENTKKLLDQCKLNCHVAGCQTKLLNLTDIWNHFKKVHISGRKPFTCSKCSEQFPHLMSFRNHIKKYYSFRCPICFKSRPDYSKLKCHVMLHSNEGTFKCSKCFKLIDSYNNLINHRKTCFGKI